MTADGGRTRLGAILRWIPAGFLLLTLPPAWVLHFSGGLGAVIGWYALISIGQLLGPVILVVLFIQLVRKRAFSRPMQVTAALTLVALWPALWGFGVLARPFPYDLDTQEPAATVRLPSNELLRVAWGGDTLETNYHAFTPDQRWAYDFLVEPAGHGSPNLEDYGCYGTPVVAPASGRVHHATDGAPDHVPGTPSADLANPTGNAVVLELATDTFLVLAHLAPGSVLVEEGDSVNEGDPLGACGNSGNTSEPHIHIHHQRQDPKEYPINFAEGLPLYFRGHDGPAMPRGGVEIDGDAVTFTGDQVQHLRVRPDAETPQPREAR